MEDYKKACSEYQETEKELIELMRMVFIGKSRLQKLCKMEKSKKLKEKKSKNVQEEQQIIDLDDHFKICTAPSTPPKDKGGIINPLYEICDKSLALLDTPKNKNQTESWLNDEIINGYIELVKARQEESSAFFSSEKICFFNTYAYAKLEQLSAEDNITNFDRILKKKKIDKISLFDRLFFPGRIIKISFKQYHWLLIVVNITRCRFEIYDSIKNQSMARKDEIVSPVVNFVKYRVELEDDDMVEHKDVDNWEIEIMSCPQQTNTCDCGVCVCLNINFLAAGRPLEYSCLDGKKSGSRAKRRNIRDALVRGKLNDIDDKDLESCL